MNQTQRKIFCIGFHKTGTTSLGKALSILGLKVKGPFGVHNQTIRNNAFEQALKFIKYYDAFQDNPWPLLYKQLDDAFPQSQFILTLRNPELWYKSALKHFGNQETEMRKWIYGKGSPLNNQELYKNTFTQHNNEVLKYFRKREGDLLILDLDQNFNWEVICNFLECPEIPRVPFPHKNKSDYGKN